MILKIGIILIMFCVIFAAGTMFAELTFGEPTWGKDKKPMDNWLRIWLCAFFVGVGLTCLGIIKEIIEDWRYPP